jgi:hypothetical protein
MKVFFDVLQVFTLLHAIGTGKLVLVPCFFAILAGIMAYLSRLHRERKFESSLDLFYPFFKSVSCGGTYPGQFSYDNHPAGFTYGTNTGIYASQPCKAFNICFRRFLLFDKRINTGLLFLGKL